MAKFSNLETLINQADGDQKFLVDILKSFLDITPPIVKRMSECTAKKDWDNLFEATHKIASSLRIVGMSEEYRDMLKSIMDYSYKKEHLEELPEMVATIENVCNEICKEIEVEYQVQKKKLK